MGPYLYAIYSDITARDILMKGLFKPKLRLLPIVIN